MNRTRKFACGFACLAALAVAPVAQAGSASLYVQDGLVACWDGIENAGAGVHNPSATVWKDLVGGYEFTLNNVTVNADRMTFAGSATSYGNLSAADTTSTFVAAKNGTMEIVYVCRSTSLQVLLQSTAESGLAFGLYNASSIITHSASSEDRKPLISFTSGTTTNSVSVRFTSGGPVSAIANGESRTLSGSNYWGSPDASMTFIGKRASNAAAFSGSFYCIRLYNRQLSNEEIAANHALDVKRFREGNHFDDALEISGEPSGIGSPSPAYGNLSGLSAGDTVAVSCGNEPAITAAGKAYACMGWKLYDVNDVVVSNGADTAFAYTHPTPAAYRRLEWQWTELLTVLPIPDQVNETFDPCRPELTVSNMVNGTAWTIGGSRTNPYFDVAYTNNFGANTALATITGKGDFTGLRLEQTFNISATKLEDDNISTTDVSARRHEAAGKYVYVFTNAAAAQVTTVKRELLFTDYLVAGGGGGGGNTSGGGGGGGGVTNATGLIGKRLVEGDTFTVSVGAGGAGASNYNSKGTNGKATSFTLGDISVSVVGGGGGGSWFTIDGVSGASGGGGTKGGAGGAGIAGIGHDGATAGALSRSGGGGGAGHAGYQYTDGSTNRAGNGGEGISSSITGEAVYYGGGGGGGGSSGGNDNYYPGFGGLGGGGDGERSIPGHPGADGFGGGGGGGGWANNQQQRGGSGGSGTVILALMRPVFEVVPIPGQVNETFEPCCPEFVVSNNQTAATWTVGGDIASPYFDVEYTDNYGAGTATVAVTGKGELHGAYCVGHFNIAATKLEDNNISTTDTSARRLTVDGKSVYVFTDTSSAHTATAKRGIYMTDYLIVGGGGGGGCRMAGGGGAGGVTNATGLVGMYIDKNDTFTLAVGAGGAGAAATSQKGGNGGDTSLHFGLLIATVSGGGGGGSWDSSKISGANGGSGGGGCQNGAGGTGIDGLGFAGAAGSGNNSAASGGGGGAGHAGYTANTTSRIAGYGGEGVSNNITGAWVVYGGGGGGGGAHKDLYWKYDAGLGGLGGGGNGGKDVGGANGVDGLGGGGGGGGSGYGGATTPIVMPGGKGGSGTVIVAIVPSDFNIEPIPDQVLVAGGSEPVPVVHSGDTLLEEGVDYTVSYTDNDKFGVALMTITGINGYAGKSATIAFKVFGCYFVDDDAAPGGDGSEASPFATISNAVESAKTAIAAGSEFVEIRVAVGTYEETDLVLDGPIVIVGASRDGVQVVDNVAGYRAFTLSHADAAVRNLTISGGGLRTNNGQGGHIRMTAGLVENCVIRNGRAGGQKGYGNGGNVWMSGGRIERCLVTGGTANWGGFPGTESLGMGLYATGGTIDNCWFKDNRTDNSDGRNSASVYLNGAVTMVNCTVTGGFARNYDGKGAGIHIANANAKVVNCVACGNYVGKGTVSTSAAANFGSGNRDRYFYCGSSFTNASCATWSVLTDEDFVNYTTFTGTAEADLKAYFNGAAYASFDWRQRLATPMVDRGTMDPAYRPADGATLDFDGNARVSGASIDLGCWEFDQSQFACGGRLSSYGVLENANVTFHATAVGPASDVVFRWDYGNGTIEGTRKAAHVYAYPEAGLFTVRLQASPDGGSTWTDWYAVPVRVVVAPSRMYVDSNCATPSFPYKTKATAATTLGAAVGALTNNVSENKTVVGGVDIVILSGSRSNDTGIFLATAVTVRGETGDPADAEIVDNVAGFRAFTLTHPDAAVSNLTISGLGFRTSGSPSGGGGHVWMSAGLVANCVIKNGRASGQKGIANGGNVYMTGGRIERCLVTGGTANWGGFCNPASYGMGLYATGGTIDNCWFKDNRDDTNEDGRNDGSVCLDGAVTMVNCTVTGGWSRDYSGCGTGIYIKNANAKAVNCVAYGNYSYFRTNPTYYVTNTLASNCGNANMSRYFYCGSAFTNASCATWTVLTDADFVKYETFTNSTWAALKAYAQSEEYATFNWHQRRHSQLVNKGTKDADYRPADSVELDLDGNPRVLNHWIDLGCWEINCAPPTVFSIR